MLASEARILRIAIALGILVGLLLSSCAPRVLLAPAPADGGARSTRENSAVEAGVTVTASLGAWTYEPRGLEQVVTPLLVEITNRSGHPLRLALRDFQLIRSDASGFAAIEPREIVGSLPRQDTAPAVALPGGRPIGFSITADNGGFVAGRSPGRGGLDGNPLLAATGSPARRVALPTGDMLRHALATGPLPSASQRSGFLFFEPFGRDTHYAAFQFELTDAETARSLGTIRLPFARED